MIDSLSSRARGASNRMKLIIEWLRKVGWYALINYPARINTETNQKPKEWNISSYESRGDPRLGRAFLSRWGKR